MCTQKVELSLHLGAVHDVFVQMISPACRQPNYLSSRVGSKPKLTWTLAFTHRPVHIPQGCLSATLLPCVSWKLLLCCSLLPVLNWRISVVEGVIFIIILTQDGQIQLGFFTISEEMLIFAFTSFMIIHLLNPAMKETDYYKCGAVITLL